jgi:hypothetical protein
MARKRGYKRRTDCIPMPAMLCTCHVASVLQWPVARPGRLGAGLAGCIDVLVHLVPEIRTGSAHNSRRVRYDGGLYILWRGGKVRLDFALTVACLDVCTILYVNVTQEA